MLPSTTKLTTHFTAKEAGVDNPLATDQIVENAKGVARWLETVRAILNEDRRPDELERKIIITSWFRPPDVNTAAGGSDTSDHKEALAADWKATGLTPYQVYTKLKAAHDKRRLPMFDQLIWYVGDNHIHSGLGPRMRQQILLKTAEGSYVKLAGEFVQRLRGFV